MGKSTCESDSLRAHQQVPQRERGLGVLGSAHQRLVTVAWSRLGVNVPVDQPGPEGEVPHGGRDRGDPIQ